MNRTDIINFYTSKKQNCRYLEIGIGNASANFNKISAAVKDAVDPVNPCNHLMSSDAFFSSNTSQYDIIFIDGDHKAAQVIKDISNSLKCLSTDGIILLHDCNPELEVHQTENITVSHWNGSVWKAILFYRMFDPNLSICTIDVDEGIGIIKPGQQELFECAETMFDFAFLCKYRKQILNLLTVQEWQLMEQR